MLYQYRVTKYDPKNRNEYGHYIKNEWTEFTAIGKKFEGKKLTLDEYLITEKKYINAILCFIECLKIDSLQVNRLEKHSLPHSDKLKNIYAQLKNKKIIKKRQIPEIVSLILRNYIWCSLIKKDKMFVHFGYDYYMYIGSAILCEKVIKQIQNLGLFVEEFKSPHLLEQE